MQLVIDLYDLIKCNTNIPTSSVLGGKKEDFQKDQFMHIAELVLNNCQWCCVPI